MSKKFIKPNQDEDEEGLLSVILETLNLWAIFGFDLMNRTS